MQRLLLDAAAAYAERTAFPEADALLAAWGEVLDDLATSGPTGVADRLDWAAKLTLLEGYRARGGLGWDHPKLAQVDLAWAELGERGLAERLQAAGRLRPGPASGPVEAAMATPPTDTRAHTRGTWVRGARRPRRRRRVGLVARPRLGGGPAPAAHAGPVPAHGGRGGAGRERR